MKLFSIEVPIVATAYIKADSADEARTIARGLEGSALYLPDEWEGQVDISGKDNDDPDLPDISLSPAMTILETDETADLVEG